MSLSTNIAALLRSLVGTGFTVSLIVDGVVIADQKVVTVEPNLVFTVNAAGVVRATLISQIDSVNF